MRRILRVGAIALAIATTATACGSSTKKVDPKVDLATAKAAILTPADMIGYKATPDTSSGAMPDSVKKPFAKCMKADVTAFDDVKGAQKADSLNFTKDQIEISAEVKIDPHKSDAVKIHSLMSKPGVEPCIAALMLAAIKDTAKSDPTVTLGRPTVTRLPTTGVDGGVDFQAKLPVSSQGTLIVAYLDLIFAQRDRAEIMLSAINLGSPVDHAVSVALTKKMVDRVGSKAA